MSESSSERTNQDDVTVEIPIHVAADIVEMLEAVSDEVEDPGAVRRDIAALRHQYKSGWMDCPSCGFEGTFFDHDVGWVRCGRCDEICAASESDEPTVMTDGGVDDSAERTCPNCEEPCDTETVKYYYGVLTVSDCCGYELEADDER